MGGTLLLLGGSFAQVVAIDRARELGYRTVLCDYLPDNPGQHHADAFHLVSTTDKAAVLEVAREEHADGVVAYGSDPAAPTAAYVSEMLGLPGIPYATARAFCEKHLFRSFLEEHGFSVPWHTSLKEGVLPSDDLRLPAIVKPSDSSGSKGVTVVQRPEQFDAAVERALRFSRNGIVEVEEFVQADHEGVIEAEIFVYKGRVVSWGLMRCLRDQLTNPLLPAGYRHPLDLSAERVALVKQSIEQLVRAGAIQNGALNIEMVITVGERLYFIDVGPRNGGNMLPHFISLASGDDLVEGTLRCAMGEPWENRGYEGVPEGDWYMHVLHARKSGRFAGVSYSPVVRDALVYENVFLETGCKVVPFENSLDIVGLAIAHFPSSGVLDGVLADDAYEHFKVLLTHE